SRTTHSQTVVPHTMKTLHKKKSMKKIEKSNWQKEFKDEFYFLYKSIILILCFLFSLSFFSYGKTPSLFLPVFLLKKMAKSGI
ncbi:MAG: hypothetical protein KAR38_14530, partial [Calditrichia bacterium]|nr:hypothetical protein [Calditrichia bacterium]